MQCTKLLPSTKNCTLSACMYIYVTVSLGNIREFNEVMSFQQ